MDSKGGIDCSACTTVKVLEAQFKGLEAANRDDHQGIQKQLDSISKVVQAHAVKIGQGVVLMGVLVFLSNVIGALVVKYLVP